MLTVHSRFANVQKSVVDHPKFSDFNDLYSYANSVEEFVKLQNINGRFYQDVEMTIMFLKHIDNDRYEKAVEPTT